MDKDSFVDSVPVARRGLGHEEDLESLPVAQRLMGGDESTTVEKQGLLKQPNADAESLGYEFHTQEADQASNGYWGRFDDPQARNITVLPAGSSLDATMPIAQARVDDRMIRHAFIRKVYMILTCQLFVTFGMCALITLHEPTRNFVIGSGMPLYWFNALTMFIMVCALSAYKVST